jgi:protein-disulfide isomerase
MPIDRKAAWVSVSTKAAILVLGTALLGPVAAAPAAKPAPLSLTAALLHDPDSPVAGNPDGDVTVVAFTDYNCPYCRKGDGDLTALIAADPKVRVVYKDWPILAKSSVTAAKVAIAAQWQGKYAAVHQALMRMSARPASDQDISQAVVASGIDVAQLNRDLDTRDDEIVALLKRNIAEADALKLQGTPVYVIGPFIEASPLDAAGFKQLVADARKEAAAPQTR